MNYFTTDAAKRRKKGELQDPIVLSPTTMGLYFDCECCLWLRARGFSRPSIPVAGITHGVDRSAKQLFDLHRRNGTLPAMLQGVFDGVLAPVRPNDVRWLDPASGCVVRGKLDDAVIDEWGWAPLDHKTCSKPFDSVRESVQLQLDTYSLLLRTMKEARQVSPFGYILYHFVQLEGNLAPDSLRERKEGRDNRLGLTSKLVRVDVDADRAWTMIWRITQVIRGPKPSPSPECEFCAWSRRGGIILPAAR